MTLWRRFRQLKIGWLARAAAVLAVSVEIAFLVWMGLHGPHILGNGFASNSLAVGIVFHTGAA